MRLLLFDYDGVLADTFDDLIRFGQEACDELGVVHAVTSDDVHGLEVMSYKTFGIACGVPEHQIDVFETLCTEKIRAKPEPPAIFDGLTKVIKKLSQENTLAIVTGNTKTNVRAFLQHHGLIDHFGEIYGLDMQGSKAEKIRLAKEMYQPKGFTYLIGDSVSDIRESRKANILSVAVAWGHQPLKTLLMDQPDEVVYAPNELLKLFGKSN